MDMYRVHVDAAYAGATAVLPSMRHWFDGVELTDSFSFNPHKWLLTNFDCAALWVADSGPLKAALSLTPAYLQAKGNALDYKVPACLLSGPQIRLMCNQVPATSGSLHHGTFKVVSHLVIFQFLLHPDEGSKQVCELFLSILRNYTAMPRK